MMIPGREREEREPGLERGVPEDALEVQRVEVEHREEPGGHEEHHDVRGAHRPHAEDAQAHEWLRRAALDDDERDEQRNGDREEPAGVQRRPALLLRLHDPVHEREQAGRHGHRARDVVALVRVRVLRLGDDPHRRDEHGDPDRER